MKVIKCDRCGAFIRDVDRNLENADLSSDIVMFVKRKPIVNGPIVRANAHLDLCDGCKISFVEWLGIDIPENPVKDNVVKIKRSGAKPKQQSSTKK